MIAFDNKETVKKLYLNIFRKNPDDASFKKKLLDSKNKRNLLSPRRTGKNGYRHYESELGIPGTLIAVANRIFAGLLPMETEKANRWFEQFFAAIRVGADLTKVWSQFAQWLLVDPINGVIQYSITERQQRQAQRLAELYKAGDAHSMKYVDLVIRDVGERIVNPKMNAEASLYTSRMFIDIRGAATTEYDSYSYDAIMSAGYAVAEAAVSAGYATVPYGAKICSEAKAAAYVRQSEKLLELLKAA